MCLLANCCQFGWQLVVEPPIWKICSSNWITFAGIGVKIKNIWNHHLVLVISQCLPSMDLFAVETFWMRRKKKVSKDASWGSSTLCQKIGPLTFFYPPSLSVNSTRIPWNSICSIFRKNHKTNRPKTSRMSFSSNRIPPSFSELPLENATVAPAASGSPSWCWERWKSHPLAGKAQRVGETPWLPHLDLWLDWMRMRNFPTNLLLFRAAEKPRRSFCGDEMMTRDETSETSESYRESSQQNPRATESR